MNAPRPLVIATGRLDGNPPSYDGFNAQVHAADGRFARVVPTRNGRLALLPLLLPGNQPPIGTRLVDGRALSGSFVDLCTVAQASIRLRRSTVTLDAWLRRISGPSMLLCDHPVLFREHGHDVIEMLTEALGADPPSGLLVGARDVNTAWSLGRLGLPVAVELQEQRLADVCEAVPGIAAVLVAPGRVLGTSDPALMAEATAKEIRVWVELHDDVAPGQVRRLRDAGAAALVTAAPAAVQAALRDAQ